MDVSGFIETIVPIGGGLLFADFLSGLLHWAEDRYGETHWPIVGKAIDEAERHHKTPMRFLTRTFKERNARVMVITSCFSVVFLSIDWINTFTMTALLFGAFSNEIHAYAHHKLSNVPTPIRVLQKVGILQSHYHHAGHHRGAKNARYCVVTNYLNPMLDGVGFWRKLERLIAMTGFKPRDGLYSGMPARPRALTHSV
jgi:hypothetical protein